MATRYNIDPDSLTCTCGTKIRLHKSGRCIDAILHRLAYGEIPELRDVGSLYTDGLRDLSLFEKDILFERDGAMYLVPQYSSDPAQALSLFAKWHDIGGTGSLNMNRSGWSANFNHGIARRVYTGGSHHMVRTRLEWMPARALLPMLIEFKRRSHVDDCGWIDGVDPVVIEA